MEMLKAAAQWHTQTKAHTHKSTSTHTNKRTHTHTGHHTDTHTHVMRSDSVGHLKKGEAGLVGTAVVSWWRSLICSSEHGF